MEEKTAKAEEQARMTKKVEESQIEHNQVNYQPFIDLLENLPKSIKRFRYTFERIDNILKQISNNNKLPSQAREYQFFEILQVKKTDFLQELKKQDLKLKM